jgi:hypothetical protein
LIDGLLSLLSDVASTLDAFGVPWVLGGSLASSHYGEPRTTMDADVAIIARGETLVNVFDELRRKYYVSESALSMIGTQGGFFNDVDALRGVKVDVFVLGDGILDRNQISRRVPAVVPGFVGDCWITAPEDVVLRKLAWCRDAGESSTVARSGRGPASCWSLDGR